jgi:hypothetical protein
MLDQLGKLLFPDDVEVLEIIPQHKYVYSIFKNGSTSLRRSNYRTVSKQELQNLTNIEVYVRNPHERFLSGVQTYINGISSEVDKNTLLYLINNYLYLNRHFCPQLYWLLNLSRFTSATFTIKPFNELSLITTHHQNASVLDPEIVKFFNQNSKILFYNEMDEVLTVNLLGKTVTIKEILTTLEKNYGTLYNDIFQTAKDITHVLSKT